MVDESLATEALNLADGADVHDIKALVALYRKLQQPQLVINEIERELRCFVARKRQARLHRVQRV